MTNEKEIIKMLTSEIWLPESIGIETKDIDGEKLITFTVGTAKGKQEIKIKCDTDTWQKIIFTKLGSGNTSKEILYHFNYEDTDVYIIHYNKFILINDIIYKHTGDLKPAKDIAKFKEFCDIFGMDVKENPQISNDMANPDPTKKSEVLSIKLTRENGSILHLNQQYSSRYAYLSVLDDLGVDPDEV